MASPQWPQTFNMIANTIHDAIALHWIHQPIPTTFHSKGNFVHIGERIWPFDIISAWINLWAHYWNLIAMESSRENYHGWNHNWQYPATLYIFSCRNNWAVVTCQNCEQIRSLHFKEGQHAFLQNAEALKFCSKKENFHFRRLVAQPWQ